LPFIRRTTPGNWEYCGGLQASLARSPDHDEELASHAAPRTAAQAQRRIRAGLRWAHGSTSKPTSNTQSEHNAQAVNAAPAMSTEELVIELP
jgi:hypothetical protein